MVPLLWSVCEAPGVQIGKAWEDVVHRWYEELYAQRFSSQTSAQVSLQGSACSHLVHAPCLDMLIILLQRSSSTSVLTKVLCLSCASSLLTTSCTCHFFPVLTTIPAEATLTSADSLYIITSLERVTLNSSDSPLKGRSSLVEWPYRAMLLKDRGRPSHLLRNWLMVFCSASTIVMGTS